MTREDGDGDDTNGRKRKPKADICPLRLGPLPWTGREQGWIGMGMGIIHDTWDT